MHTLRCLTLTGRAPPVHALGQALGMAFTARLFQQFGTRRGGGTGILVDQRIDVAVVQGAAAGISAELGWKVERA